MAQLTLKVLQSDTNEALTDLEQRISIVEDALAAEVDVAQVWSFDEDGEPIQITVDAPEGDPIPEWVEPVVEALKGVRLQRAQEIALALEAKYFPPEEVESEEVVA